MAKTSMSFYYVLSPGLNVLWLFISFNFHSSLMRKTLIIYK